MTAFCRTCSARIGGHPWIYGGDPFCRGCFRDLCDQEWRDFLRFCYSVSAEDEPRTIEDEIADLFHEAQLIARRRGPALFDFELENRTAHRNFSVTTKLNTNLAVNDTCFVEGKIGRDWLKNQRPCWCVKCRAGMNLKDTRTMKCYRCKFQVRIGVRRKYVKRDERQRGQQTEAA